MTVKRRKLNPELGEELKREGMERADRAAPLPWKAMVMKIVREMTIGTEFTTDILWVTLQHRGCLVPPEPRAMGALMASMAKGGLITKVKGEFWESDRPEAHRNPKQVWKRI